MASTPSSPTRKPNILSLPSEILLLIFEDACSFADLKALVLTSPIFNELWKEHMSIISSILIKRSIVCYPEARMLAEYQESKKESNLDSKSRTLAFNKRILTNSRVASRACNLFIQTIKSQFHDDEDSLCIHSMNAPKDVEMSVTGRSRFISAFYQILRYSAMLQRTSRPRELRLEKLPLEILFPMFRLCTWSSSLGTRPALGELLNLIRPSTRLGRSEEHIGRSSHPWLTTCEYICENRALGHLMTATATTCWFDFFEGCQQDIEPSSDSEFQPLFEQTRASGARDDNGWPRRASLESGIGLKCPRRWP